MTKDKSGVWETGKNAGANAIADENPVNDHSSRFHRASPGGIPTSQLQVALLRLAIQAYGFGCSGRQYFNVRLDQSAAAV